MPSYDPNQLLVSLHVPKTAGMSLREALQGWFGDRLALHYRGDRGEPPARATPGPGVCVHGHFNRCRGIGALDYYPGASQFIVFLRNPFDRFVSQWRYLHFQHHSGVAVPELDDQPSFEQWLERRAAGGGRRRRRGRTHSPSWPSSRAGSRTPRTPSARSSSSWA